MTQFAYRPVKFFGLTLPFTWASWFAAAYFSYQAGGEPLMIPFIVLGTAAPLIVGLSMILGSGSREMKKDLLDRFVQIRRIKLRHVLFIFLFMPASILLAISISLLFGMSPAQFRISEVFMGGQAVLSLMIAILAPTFEEIGWRSYGVDSLRSRFTLLKTSLVFYLLWLIWHVPMFFINNYYQNELWKSGPAYVINFFVSLLPLTIILNWLYYKTDRSILAAILFHIVTVISAEATCIVESVKFIQTGILLIIAAGIVLYDRAFSAGRSSIEA